MSLAARPERGGPQWMSLVGEEERGRRRVWRRGRRGAGVPRRRVRVPEWAEGTPPETGASMRWAEREVSLVETARAAGVEEEEEY